MANGQPKPSGFTNTRIKKRVLTHVDFALRHHVRLHTTQRIGTEQYTQAVADVAAPLIPPNELLVPDAPIVFDLPALDPASVNSTAGGGPSSGAKRQPLNASQRSRKSSLDASSPGVGSHHQSRKSSANGPSAGASNSSPKRHAVIEDGPPRLTSSELAALAKDPAKLPLEDILTELDDHNMVFDRAVNFIHEQLDREKRVFFQRMSMLRRQSAGGCEPMPGVKTMFYFPSPADDVVESDVLKRKRILEAVVRQLEASFFFSPLVWEALTSFMPGALLYGTRRSYPTIFEFSLVITPRQMFENVINIVGDLADPVHIRRIVYAIFGRNIKELQQWNTVRRMVDSETSAFDMISLKTGRKKRRKGSQAFGDDKDQQNSEEGEKGGSEDADSSPEGERARAKFAKRCKEGSAESGLYRFHAVDER